MTHNVYTGTDEYNDDRTHNTVNELTGRDTDDNGTIHSIDAQGRVEILILYVVLAVLCVPLVCCMSRSSELFVDHIPCRQDSSGRISGVVRAESALQPIQIALDERMSQATGRDSILDQSLMVDSQLGVANCVIALIPDNVLDKEGIATAVELCKIGAEFSPRVVVAQRGATLRLKNLSSPCRCFRTFEKLNEGVDCTLDIGQSKEIQLLHTSDILYFSHMYPWMKAWVLVVDTQYFTKTLADGAFAFDTIPPGHYEVMFWHERVGWKRISKITTELGSHTEMTLTMVKEPGKGTDARARYGVCMVPK